MRSKKIIGISLGFNTSVAIVDTDHGIIDAITEERLTRVRNTKMFPINALKAFLDEYGIKDFVNDGEIIFALSSYEVINMRLVKYLDINPNHVGSSDIFAILEHYITEKCEIGPDIKISFVKVDHHKAHEITASYLSGFKLDDTITVTSDGFGDGVSATITTPHNEQLIAKEGVGNSLALVYQYVTGALGFTEHKDEGKITGLSAFGHPVYKDLFSEMILEYDTTTNSFARNYEESYHKTNYSRDNKNIFDFNSVMNLKDAVYDLVKNLLKGGANNKDIAASIQAFTEEQMILWLRDKMKISNIKNVGLNLTGGLFANVNVVKRIHDFIPEINRIYVSPYAGDDGNAIGAALQVLILEYGKKNINLKAFSDQDLYLTKLKTNNEKIKDFVDFNEDSFIVADDVKKSEYIAESLALGEIICVAQGDKEFGARAYGNNSILFDATNVEPASKLMDKLNRDHFMPYAPMTLDIFAEDLFELQDISRNKKALMYMGTVVPLKQSLLSLYVNAVHKNNLARVQVLSSEDNKMIYDAIQKFDLITNKKMIINTSFNLHGDPVVFTEKEAYECFKAIGADILVLDAGIIVNGLNDIEK